MNKYKWLIFVLIILLGGVAGYFYWYYIGCNTGTCPITSSWKGSTLTGGFIGYLISDSLVKRIKPGKETPLRSRE